MKKMNYTEYDRVNGNYSDYTIYIGKVEEIRPIYKAMERACENLKTNYWPLYSRCIFPYSGYCGLEVVESTERFDEMSFRLIGQETCMKYLLGDI